MLTIKTSNLKDGKWTKFTYENEKYGIYVELKHPYSATELALALKTLSEKIIKKETDK